MSLASRIKGAINGMIKGFERDDDQGRQSMLGTNTYSHDPIQSFSRTDYLGLYSSRVYACVTAISDSVSSLHYRLKDEKGEDIDHEYLDLVTPELIESIVSFMKLGGSAYVWKVMLGKKVIALRVLRPDLVKGVKNKVGDVVRYELYNGGKIITFDPQEIMVFVNFNPFETYPNTTKGYSEIQATAITMKLDQASEVRNRSRFTNSAEAGAILTTEGEISKDTQDRLMEQREQKRRGANNAHRLAILSGGLKYDNPKPGQREMDFVNSQRRNMDKILSIYKVPRAIIGMGEGVNVGNVRAFEYIFARRTIKPLANKIARVIDAHLFQDAGTFCFENIVPHDDEQMRSHYLSGGLTKNEYRSVLGLMPDKEGDIYIDGTIATIVPIEDDHRKRTYKTQIGKSSSYEKQSTTLGIQQTIEQVVKEHTPGTEDYYEAKYIANMKRLVDHEQTYENVLRRIFLLQKDDIMKQLGSKKVTKKHLPQLGSKYAALYLSLLQNPQYQLMKQEGDLAMHGVDTQGTFNLTVPNLIVRQKQNIQKLAKAIDTYTDTLIEKAIHRVRKIGGTIDETLGAVDAVFLDLLGKRLDTITKNEVTRVNNKTRISAREQTKRVVAKIRYTSMDERVCERCGPMHGRRIALRDTYFQKGETFTGDEGGELRFDYDDVIGGNLHVNCRCGVHAVVE